MREAVITAVRTPSSTRNGGLSGIRPAGVPHDLVRRRGTGTAEAADVAWGADEGVCRNSSAERLAQLARAFREVGPISADNSNQISGLLQSAW
jgi:hypothetical protein